MGSRSMVGFLGFDELSLELATSLLRSGYSVRAFDPHKFRPCVAEFSNLGGVTCTNPLEAGKGAAALVLLVSQLDQMDDIIFGPQGILKGLSNDAVIILQTMLLPTDIQKLENRLAELFRAKIKVFRWRSYRSNGCTAIILHGFIYNYWKQSYVELGKTSGHRRQLWFDTERSKFSIKILHVAI